MDNRMAFSVNTESPIAVYVQIENQVQFAIASGAVSPGDTLPSVREMSQKLGVNPNTVTKAYRDLELLRLVQTRRGVGVMIADKARKLCRDNIHKMVKTHLRDAVAECMASGIDPEEVRAIVTHSLAAKLPPYANSQDR